MLFKKKLLLSTLALSGLVLSGENTYAMEDEFNKNENPSHTIDGHSLESSSSVDLENSTLEKTRRYIHSSCLPMLPQWQEYSEEYQNAIKKQLNKIIDKNPKAAQRAMDALNYWIVNFKWNEKIKFNHLIPLIENLAKSANNEKNLQALIYNKPYSFTALIEKNNWNIYEAINLARTFKYVDSEKISILCQALESLEIKKGHIFCEIRSLIYDLNKLEKNVFITSLPLFTCSIEELNNTEDPNPEYTEWFINQEFDFLYYDQILKSFKKVGQEKTSFLRSFIEQMKKELSEIGWHKLIWNNYCTITFIEMFEHIDIEKMQTLCTCLLPWIKGLKLDGLYTNVLIKSFKIFDENKIFILSKELLPWALKNKDANRDFIKAIGNLDNEKIPLFCQSLPERDNYYDYQIKIIIDKIKNLDQGKFSAICHTFPKRYTEDAEKTTYFKILKELIKLDEHEIKKLTSILPKIINRPKYLDSPGNSTKDLLEFIHEIKNLDKSRITAIYQAFPKEWTKVGQKRTYLHLSKKLIKLDDRRFYKLISILPKIVKRDCITEHLINDIDNLNNLENSLDKNMQLLVKGEKIDPITHSNIRYVNTLGNILLGRALSEHLNKEMHKLKKSIYFVKQHEKNYLENSVTKQRRELIPLFVLSQEEVHSSKGQTALLSLPKALAEYVFGFLDAKSMRELSLASKSFYVKLFPLMEKKKMISEARVGLLFPLVKGLYESHLKHSEFESALKIHSLEEFYNKHCRN